MIRDALITNPVHKNNFQLAKHFMNNFGKIKTFTKLFPHMNLIFATTYLIVRNILLGETGYSI